MIRKEFKSNNPRTVASEVASWLGCTDSFISESFARKRLVDTNRVQVRYFERYQQNHATVVVDRTMSEVLDNWMDNIKKYPPSEIFYQQTGPKSEKAEKRCKGFCEDLYRFNYPEGQVNILAELSASYRELQVLWMMGFGDIKSERIFEVTAKFLNTAKDAITALEAMHKKDQQLNEYYKSWKVKYQDISTEIYNMTKDYK